MQESEAKNIQISEERKYLSFYLGDEEYALDIQYVIDIITRTSVTYMPRTPDYIIGIINLRGKIVPVVDARIRFNKMPIEQTDKQCIIVLEWENTNVGILVDSVAEVSDIAKDKIMNTGYETGYGANQFVSGIVKLNGKIKLIVNCEKILELDQTSGL